MDYQLPRIPGIDWEKAYHYIPEKTVLLEVLREFYASREEEVQKLRMFRDALEQEPSEDHYTEYRIQAHSMKASLRSIGSDLFDPALALEEAGRDQNGEVIRKDTEPFAEAYKKLAEQFSGIFGGETEGTEYSPEAFRQDIQTIREAMERFDISLLQQTLKEMKEMELPVEFREHFEQLEAGIRDLSAEDVWNACNTLEALNKTV